MTTMILGLGSNLADRLANLRQAWRLIGDLPQVKVTRVSPVYVSDALLPTNAPAAWDIPFLNLAIRIETTLEPHALLVELQHIQVDMGREQSHARWSPRMIDIDILASNDLALTSDVLTIPHPHLLTRPFALWPLADIAPDWQIHGKPVATLIEPWDSRFSGEAPSRTRQIQQRIETPELMGIINVTPDSFADGGRFLHVDKAIQQAIDLVTAGATVLDIGAESTAPSATAITAAEEWARLSPILSAINEQKSSLFLTPKISIDTRHAATAAKALAAGADWINDVSGLDCHDMRAIVAAAHADCVIMHHMCIPEDRKHILPRDQDPIATVLAWGKQRIQALVAGGIAHERIIFDPGVGFGKQAEQSLQLLQNVAMFKKLGVRLLIGHSRKSYLTLFTALPAAARDIETTAISLYLAKQGVDYLRLHNVDTTARALKVAAGL